jgi:hypothetical protein
MQTNQRRDPDGFICCGASNPEDGRLLAFI